MAVEDKNDPFVSLVGSYIGIHRLLQHGQAVVVAVSGGADSVALLEVLRRLAPAGSHELTIAHLDHAIRPDSSQDAEFVRRMGRNLGLPCVVQRRDVPHEAARTGEGIEQAARRLRYEFLLDVAGRADARAVAVAHHADDNVETILYRILRGTHLRGLAGIPVSRDLGGGVRLIRPLLGVTRDEVEAFVRRAGLSYRKDSTNDDVAYRRNFIRHELLPLIRDRLNGRADEALLRLAEAAGEVDGFVAQQALDAAPGRAALDLGTLRAMPVVLRKYALRDLAERSGVPLRMLSSKRLDELAEMVDDSGPAALSLPGHFTARRGGGQILIDRAGGQALRTLMPAIELACPGSTLLPDGSTVTCEVAPLDPQELRAHMENPRAGVELLDADQVSGGLSCRPRASGDTFKPLGAPGRQTVSDFLTNQKIPAELREAARCICDDLGVVYLAPLRIDHRVRVTEATRRIIRIRYVSRVGMGGGR